MGATADSWDRPGRNFGVEEFGRWRLIPGQVSAPRPRPSSVGRVSGRRRLDGRRRVTAGESGGPMSGRRALVTGMGATTPLGGDVHSTWEGLLAGASGVRRLTECWADDLPVTIAAPVRTEPAEVLGEGKCRRLDRVQQLALV